MKYILLPHYRSRLRYRNQWSVPAKKCKIAILYETGPSKGTQKCSIFTKLHFRNDFLVIRLLVFRSLIRISLQLYFSPTGEFRALMGLLIQRVADFHLNSSCRANYSESRLTFCILHMYKDSIQYLIWSKAITINTPSHTLNGYLVDSSFNSSPPSVAYMRQWIGSALFQIMACRLFGAKPSYKPMLAYC